MFGRSRRNRPTPIPLTRETADPNAATAAASAFMRRDPSVSQQLSSAAAAAALRARPTIPTNVAEVQTKRTASHNGGSRRPSPSLRGRSRERGRGHAGEAQSVDASPRRSPSAGSMSERTFRRSPSPGRPVPPSRDQNVPPVPTLSDDAGRYDDDDDNNNNHSRQAQARTQPVTSNNRAPGHQRNKTEPIHLQTQNFRTASQKLRDGSQASWFGAASTRASAPAPAPAPASARAAPDAAVTPRTRVSASADDAARPVSPSASINFSLPRARMSSPAPSSASADQALVYDANSRRMIPRAEALFRSQSVRDAAERPVRRSGRGDAVSQSGSHLTRGTMSRTQVSPATAATAATAAAAAAATAVPAVVDGDAVTGNTYPAPPAPAPEPEAEAEAEAEAEQQPQQPQHTMQEEGQQAPTGRDITTPVDELDESRQRQRHRAEEPAVPSEQKQEQPPPPPPPPREPTQQLNVIEEPGRPTARSHRVSSVSPVRSAHFAPSADQLLVRHEPPSRSLSPRKSALKNSGGARGASPSDDSSDASSYRPSPNPTRDDKARKKSARVSFNDEGTAVPGEPVESTAERAAAAVEPKAASQRRSWYGLLGRRNNAPSPTSSTTNDDGTGEAIGMTPRPALPLFGSVRDKKPREQPDSERPLVRPSGRLWSASSQSPPSPPPLPAPLPQTQTQIPTPPPEAATDSAIGGVIAAAAAAATAQDSSKNEANISRTREPLPPVVTSIEGTGYDSSSVEGSDLEEEDADLPDVPGKLEGDGANVATAATTTADAPDLPGQQIVEQHAKRGIPSISIVEPTPPARDEEMEDSPENDETTTPPRDGTLMSDIQEEEDESSDDSAMYSDAYEDMSEADEGGFLSLDAVLTAPVASETKTTANAQVRVQDGTAAPVAPSSGADDGNDANKREQAQAQAQAQASPDDWDHAKAYWRSLTVEKRRQLEREALEDAGEDGDQEDFASSQQSRKTKKKTTTTTNHHHPALPAAPVDYRSDSSIDTAPKLRKTLRGSQPDSGAAQKQQPAVNMRRTLRSPPPNTQGAPPPRQQAPSNNDGHRRIHSSDGSSAAASAAVEVDPPLQRRGSDSSESSFRRARPVSHGGSGLRSTMRSGASPSQRDPEPSTASRSAPAPVPPPKSSGRFSLRSLSPAGRRSSFTPSPAPTDGEEIGSGASRFADSSDEEDGSGGLHRSRFIDSSDEEDGTRTVSARPGTSSRGASYAAAAALGVQPPRQGSTPHTIPKQKQKQQHGMQIQRGRSGRGLIGTTTQAFEEGYGKTDVDGDAKTTDTGVVAKSHRRRGSFMSGILGRRRDDKSGKISRGAAGESAARRDTRLERSPEHLNVLRSNSGRLQKRDSHSAPAPAPAPAPAFASAVAAPGTSWPLPAGAEEDDTDRPGTAVSSQVVGGSGSEVSKPPGQKKKFGALRKMFRLDE
ncbi:Conserved hypothetical, protein [Geosmithia morbida]|uniref:Conserved hypothetical, protein n=1 Tax=Geosmithia morbida TaxID=1094350 RepID=A0A9P4YZK9_9HYPO|nr:Conserved hypothetical, protein [Geosmithia morbida]KAF4124687.1 Conserved hypothetical, protein [Geosmithia morbida]